MIKNRSLLLAGLTLVLAGCGGGGSSTPAAPVASTTAFPLNAGYRAFVQAGSTASFAISGTCGGTATQTVSATGAATTFEGAPATPTTVTQQLSLTGCTPASIATTFTNYISPTTFIPLGSVTPGTEYVVAQATPAALPTTVKVGDTAAVVTYNVYSNSTKATLTGTRSASYVVVADTANTALVTIIQRDLTGTTLNATQQTTYRIDAAGNLTLLSIDSVAGATHLVLTKT